WILPFRAYKETHMEHHAKNATTHDVDLVFLAELGFRPGLTVRQYWRQLLRSIVSPRFHALYFRARMKANFVSACPLRATAAGVYTTALLAATWGHWGTLALAFLLPVFPLYHVAGLLQLLTEHNWVRVGENIKGQKALTVRRLTNARFMGEAAPALPATSLAGARAWLRWTFRMLFLHLPARLFVVQGDLPAHDLHHTKTDRNWAIAIHARRAAVLERPEHYYEIWGLATAILATFELLSRLPATAKLGEPLTYGEIADTYLSM
ncbi:MAG TPA: hypothetical protein VGE76_01125, partial [Opitutaceae bacterium]